MHILVINSGSSSIKFSIFAEQQGWLRSMYEGELSGIGSPEAKLEFRDAIGKDLGAAMKSRDGEIKADSMREGIATVERAVGLVGLPAPDAVGYRVVHPGPHLRGHQRLTANVLAELRSAITFAPLHDPPAIEIIDEMMPRLSGVPHFACFDTVFHETMPEEAYTYPIPKELRDQGVRRYGFHGLSCESIVAQMREAQGLVFPQSMIIAHLGSGCSVTACVDGRSVDTTMGLTPTGGVVMGTRPGDLDPGLLLYLLRQPGASADSVEAMLNHNSGLKALGGVNDMRELRRAALAGDPHAALAIRIFCRSIIKAAAEFTALYAPQAIVFTGGIGEHDPATRAEIASGLNGLGVQLDLALNQVPLAHSVGKVSAGESGITVFMAPAQEDLMIAGHVRRMCRESQPPAPPRP